MSASNVQLWLYDLSNGMAASMSRQLTGRYFEAVWHSSIVVFGQEIYFGQGIQRCRPGGSHHGMPLKTVDLGTTYIDQDTFEDYLASLSDVYAAEKYHLLEHNCNSFSNDVAGFLTGGGIPQDVIDLPKQFLSTPFGSSLRPMIDNMFRQGAGIPPQSSAPALPPHLASQFASNPALSGALQQVAQAATRSHGTNEHTAEILSAQLTAATNMASFRSILSSNKCVAVMFTGEWCGPCKTVKPVFESLAQRTASLPPLAFVLVDTTAGREIANHYSISAVPTFKFFLKGEQLHEVKGADARELRTQVDILAMTGFPTHPHMKVQCKAVSTLSTSPILSGSKPNFEAALSKLATFQPAIDLAEIRATVLLLQRGILGAEEAGRLVSATSSVLQALEPSQLLPILDIWRFGVLQDLVASALATARLGTPEASTLPASLVERCATADALTKPIFITLLRFLGNALASPLVASALLMETKARTHMTQLLVKALLEEDKAIRTAAGNLAYSISGWLRKSRKDWVDDDAVDSTDQEEFESELLTALLEATDREQSAEVAHRLVAALAGLFYKSPFAVESLAPLADALEGHRILLAKRLVLEEHNDALKVIADVIALLQCV